MTMPPLPAAGDTNWRDDWAQAVHNAAAEVISGRLTDALVRVATNHGVKGDGIADDGPAIVAAATALANDGGGVLLFPEGRYRFDTILLDGVSNVELRGVGDATHFQTTYTPDGNASAIRWRGDNVAFTNIRLEAVNPLPGPQAGFGNYDLLRIGGVIAQFRNGVLIENCTFIDGGGANAYCTKNVVIRNNRYTKSHGNSFGAVQVIENVLITGNYAHDGNDDLIAVTCDSTAAVAGGTRGAIVTNNILDTTDAKAICFAGVDGGLIANNHCRYTFATGIIAIQESVFALQPTNRVIIANNIVRQAGKCFGPGRLHAETISGVAIGIQVDSIGGFKQCQIVGNQILDTHDRAIQVGRGTEILIADNVIVGAGGIGINVGDAGAANFTTCQRVDIRGNIIRQTTGGMSLGSITQATVTGNQISSYLNGATPARRGIFYAYLKNALITGNVIVNDDGGQETILESPVASVNARVFGNHEVSDPAAADIGSVFTIGGKRISFGTAAPTSGAWGPGDFRINSNPASGASPWAWICRTAGTPGTWQALTPVNWTGTSNTFQGTQTFNYVQMNNQTEPATPIGGGVFFVSDGALKWKGSAGTVTTIAPA